MHARARPTFPVSRAKLPHGFSCVYSLFPAPFLPFLPLAPRLQAASSREIIHIQAGRCGARDCLYTGGLARFLYGHRNLEGTVRRERLRGATASTAVTTKRNSASLTCLPLGVGRHVRTSRGSLQPQTRRHRRCARVASRKARPFGKPREPYARVNWAKDPYEQAYKSVEH